MQQNKPSHLETFLSELEVLRLNKFCPSFHNWQCFSAASFSPSFEKKILIAAIFDIS